ncbi:MAG: hypothetical protein VZR54_04350 [Ruminococcus sp.]|jgi:hypothetical protein|nr:hypothetical protein [Ruminococcus sp.]
MASNLDKKIKEIENTQLKPGELFMYGHCDNEGEINAGICCEEADLEAIESTLQYITMQTARVLYDSNPELSKEDITEILFTDLFGSLNLFIQELDHGKDEDDVRSEAADLLTDCFEEFDFYGDFE